VNGRTFAGPLHVVRKGTLKEISFVALGADDGTSVHVAAKQAIGESTMPQPDKPLTPLEQGRATEAAETNRVADIRKACQDQYADIEAKAIEEGWAVEKAELEVLRASRPKSPTPPRQTSRSMMGDMLQASAMMLGGFEAGAVKACGEEIAQRARDLRFTSLVDLVRASFALSGVEAPHDRGDMIRAAFSTVSLPTILGNTFSKIILEAYTEAPSSWDGFAKVVDLPDFKTAPAARPSFVGNLDPVGPTGELHHGVMTEEAFANIKVGTFGKVLRVSYQDIINDDRGVFGSTGPAYGRMARRGLNDNVWGTIMANAASFFGVGHGNNLTTATSELDNGALALAIQTMRTKRTTEGDDLDIVPAVLAVPPELEAMGRSVLQSEYIQQIADEGGPTGNPLREAVKLAVESRLSNTDKFEDASAKAWYLFASPADAPVIVAFLNGARAPQIQFFGMDHDADTLGVAWRVHFDYGSALCDYRAALKADGE